MDVWHGLFIALVKRYAMHGINLKLYADGTGGCD